MAVRATCSASSGWAEPMKRTRLAIIALVVTAALLATSDQRARSSSAPVTTDPVTTDPADGPSALVSEYSDWSVSFEDNFDGATLGPQWTTCYWWQVDGGCTIASNHELEWYRPEGVRVTGGVLQLEATADQQVSSEGVALPYRSGMASTGPADDDGGAAGFTFTYGYVEAVVRFPGGGGTWPAVWLLSADLTSTPEVDIVEHYGNDSVITSRVHQRVDGEKVSQGFETPLLPTADGWRRVGVLWTERRVEFYLDDVLTGTVDDETLVPDTPMYLIVNLAMAGRAGAVDDQALPQRFDIDRIRIWQQKESA